MIKTLLSALGIALIPGALFAQKVDNTPVGSFSLTRYLGTWYEIARIDHAFERGMESTTARYYMDDGGNLRIINSGTKNGRFRTAAAKARTTDTPGLLRVSFFGPFYSDYRVLMVSNDYQHALVGGRSGKYLWLLSRQAHPDDRQTGILLREATARGYDVSSLTWVEQH